MMVLSLMKNVKILCTFNPHKGKAIQLVDSLDEINKSTVCGDEHPSELIDSAITQIIGDIKAYDLTALSELLQFLPEECLKNYIG